MPKTFARDAALRRLTRANRWLIAGSVALTGVLTEVAAQAFPGKTISAKAKTSSGQHGEAASSPSSGSSTGTGSLQPPQSAPESSSSPSQETSPGQESAPTQTTPAQEAGGSQQPAPAQESAPAHESTGPVVSGGS